MILPIHTLLQGLSASNNKINANSNIQFKACQVQFLNVNIKLGVNARPAELKEGVEG